MADSDKIPQIDPTEIEILIEKLEQNKLEERERRLIVASVPAYRKFTLNSTPHPPKGTQFTIRSPVAPGQSHQYADVERSSRVASEDLQRSDRNMHAQAAVPHLYRLEVKSIIGLA